MKKPRINENAAPIGGLTRREFMLAAAAAGSGAFLGALAPQRARAEAGPLVVRAVGGAPGRLVEAAVAALGGMKEFVKPGQTVVVKPNLGWDRLPEYAADTNPEVLAAVVSLCLLAGAGKVKVFDRPCNDPRRCYASSGALQTLEALGDSRIEISHIDERRFRETPIPGGIAHKSWPLYGDALDADVFINVPIAKHHGASVLTLGLKNLMGVAGGNRAQLHRNLNESLVDLNRVIKSRLTIMDAWRILTANGPQGGDLNDVKLTRTVIAGADIVAVDAVSCSLFGLRLSDVPAITSAAAAGLGVADTERIRIKEIQL